jgi:hypothetical protein
MNILDYYPSDYLRAADLHGKSPVVTILRVSEDEVGANRDLKPIIFFEGKDKGLILNKTNSTSLADMFGGETENWIGERITLFETSVSYQGKTVPAIRIRMAPRGRAAEAANAAIERAQQKASTAAELIDDDIPF